MSPEQAAGEELRMKRKVLKNRRYTHNRVMSVIACLRHLTNGRDLTLSLRLVVLSKVTVNSNV